MSAGFNAPLFQLGISKSTAAPLVPGYRSMLALWAGGASVIPSGGGGQVVKIFSGVSTADGVVYHSGISRPTVVLTPLGGGLYTVTITHEVSGNLNPGVVICETYLIDGELP